MADSVYALLSDLESVINRARHEWDLTYAEAIGCLEITKDSLLRELHEDDESKEETE